MESGHLSRPPQIVLERFGPVGILPSGEVRRSVRSDRADGRRDGFVIAGWTFPGKGESLPDCGAVVMVGCLNVDLHPGGKAYVAFRRHSCDKRECPKDYTFWAVKEGTAGARRVRRGLGILQAGKAAHVVVSPPPDTPLPRNRGELRRLRSMAQKVLKAVGYLGGALIFHHVRCKGGVHEGPHFHATTPGWNEGVAVVYGATGWVVKRVRVLEDESDIAGVLIYALTHAAIAPGTHALTWWGAMSYAKLRLPPEVEPPAEDDLCPHCHGILTEVTWLGGEPPPTEATLVDADLVGFSNFEYAKEARRYWTGHMELRT